jgi:hypothetical protein
MKERMGVCTKKTLGILIMSASSLPPLFKNLRQVQNGVVRYHGVAVWLKNFISTLTCSSHYVFAQEWLYKPLPSRVSSSSHIMLLFFLKQWRKSWCVCARNERLKVLCSFPALPRSFSSSKISFTPRHKFRELRFEKRISISTCPSQPVVARGRLYKHLLLSHLFFATLHYFLF